MWDLNNNVERRGKPATKQHKCPVGANLGVLGRTWTFHILRNLETLGIDRFNQILRSLPGLTPRVLIMRLKELEGHGLIQPVVIQEKPRFVRWVLTEKGKDILPIFASYTSFATKWYSPAKLTSEMAMPQKEPMGVSSGKLKSRLAVTTGYFPP